MTDVLNLSYPNRKQLVIVSKIYSSPNKLDLYVELYETIQYFYCFMPFRNGIFSSISNQISHTHHIPKGTLYFESPCILVMDLRIDADAHQRSRNRSTTTSILEHPQRTRYLTNATSLLDHCGDASMPIVLFGISHEHGFVQSLVPSFVLPYHTPGRIPPLCDCVQQPWD